METTAVIAGDNVTTQQHKDNSETIMFTHEHSNIIEKETRRISCTHMDGVRSKDNNEQEQQKEIICNNDCPKIDDVLIAKENGNSISSPPLTFVTQQTLPTISPTTPSFPIPTPPISIATTPHSTTTLSTSPPPSSSALETSSMSSSPLRTPSPSSPRKTTATSPPTTEFRWSPSSRINEPFPFSADGLPSLFESTSHYTKGAKDKSSNVNNDVDGYVLPFFFSASDVSPPSSFSSSSSLFNVGSNVNNNNGGFPLACTADSDVVDARRTLDFSFPSQFDESSSFASGGMNIPGSPPLTGNGHPKRYKRKKDQAFPASSFNRVPGIDQVAFDRTFPAVPPPTEDNKFPLTDVSLPSLPPSLSSLAYNSIPTTNISAPPPTRTKIVSPKKTLVPSSVLHPPQAQPQEQSQPQSQILNSTDQQPILGTVSPSNSIPSNAPSQTPTPPPSSSALDNNNSISKKKAKKTKKKGDHQSPESSATLLNDSEPHSTQQQVLQQSQQSVQKRPTSPEIGDMQAPQASQLAQTPEPKTVRNKKAKPQHKNQNLWAEDEKIEREKIKEFWLGLRDTERRALVKLEKDAVLKKMKEQQKHTCSCSVCGRRRTVIEEELEMLYDAYYEELQLYETDKAGTANKNSAGMFSFAKSLSAKGADELLKNEGKKFLEMMERLAERRMRKEEAMRRSNEKYEGEDDDDEEEYEGEEEIDEGDDYEEEEDDEEEGEGEDGDDDISDEQQLEEGRQMFQVFAAKMFEQRVLTAYRQKVAYQKQKELIQEEKAAKRVQMEKIQLKAEKRRLEKARQLAIKQQTEEQRERRRKAVLEQEKREREKEEKRREEERRESQRKREEEQRKRQEEEEKRIVKIQKQAEEKRIRRENKERVQKEKKEAEEREKKERLERERKEREEKQLEEKRLAEERKHAQEKRTAEENAAAKKTKKKKKNKKSSAPLTDTAVPTPPIPLPSPPLTSEFPEYTASLLSSSPVNNIASSPVNSIASSPVNDIPSPLAESAVLTQAPSKVPYTNKQILNNGFNKTPQLRPRIPAEPKLHVCPLACSQDLKKRPTNFLKSTQVPNMLPPQIPKPTSLPQFIPLPFPPPTHPHPHPYAPMFHPTQAHFFAPPQPPKYNHRNNNHSTSNGGINAPLYHPHPQIHHFYPTQQPPYTGLVVRKQTQNSVAPNNILL